MGTSLIIPAWNAEKTIINCLLSSIHAANSPDEIIVVDDCSEDQTANFVLNLKKNTLKLNYIK